MKVVFDRRCLEYKTPFHPESPGRVSSAFEYLKKKKYQFVSPEEFPEDKILKVHTKNLVEKIKQSNFYDPDTPALENIFYYAKLAVDSALTAYELIAEEEVVFSLSRPPGHHAGKDFLGGFCYLNNIAVASGYGVSEGRKIAILDLDAHHGNGTEDIFLDKSNIMYVSLHQVPLFPGTGYNSRGNIYNFPLPSGTKDQDYLNNLEEALEIITDFNPEILAISAGFDSYYEDPLTGLLLTEDCFVEIGKKLSRFKPCFFVLEGGYTSKIGILIDLILSHI